MEWYLMVWRKYADFNGRSRRKEYWMFTLFNVLILGVLEILLLAGSASARDSGKGMALVACVAIVTIVYSLAVLIPSVAVGVRRLHDTGKSGWFLLIGLVPFVGAIIVIVLSALDSTPGPNEYGPNPKLSQAITA